jgi:hypothetical protein
VKTCRLCGESKPLSEFYAMKGMRDGHRNECKTCWSARAAARYRANPAAAKERTRRWQQENRERYNAGQRERRKQPARKAKERAGHLRRKYGITLEEYDAMLAAQGGVCAICGRQPTDGISLHVDHDHVSGRRRKLLCFKCNNALGDFDDDPDLLRTAMAYLDAHDPEVEELTRCTKARLAALRN